MQLVSPVAPVAAAVGTTSSSLKLLMWWLFSTITSLWETKNSRYQVLTSQVVNSDLSAHNSLVHEQLQNLVLSHDLQRKKKMEYIEENIVSVLKLQEQFQKELHLKDEMLREQQDRHAQLALEMKLLREQMDHLGVELQSKKDHTVKDHSHLLWRKNVRRLENQIRLLQVSQSARPCCNVLPTVAIEEHVMKFLSGVFSSDGEAEKKIPGIQTWVSKLFVAKDDLEAKLGNITSSLKQSVGEANRHSAQILMAAVSDQIKQEYVKQSNARIIEERRNWAVPSVTENCTITASQVRDIVNNALHVYDADKTGMVDYALESSGGSVINTRCTETYSSRTATLSLLGFALWWPTNNPRIVIQPGAHPGECWAFRGAQGYLVIRLSGRVKISAFSLEHIPVTLAPNGKIDSAPKDFSVWGLEHENVNANRVLLGKYVYEHNGTSIQIFNVQRSDCQPYEIVELVIESNHGNMEYTCLYRFRVHGVLSL